MIFQNLWIFFRYFFEKNFKNHFIQKNCDISVKKMYALSLSNGNNCFVTEQIDEAWRDFYREQQTEKPWNPGFRRTQDLLCILRRQPLRQSHWNQRKNASVHVLIRDPLRSTYDEKIKFTSSLALGNFDMMKNLPQVSP